jgi:hypothetical protein
MGLGKFLKTAAQVSYNALESVAEEAEKKQKKANAYKEEQEQLVNSHLDDIMRYDDERLIREYETTEDNARKYAAKKIIKERMDDYEYQYEAYGDEKILNLYKSSPQRSISRKVAHKILKERSLI